MESIIVACITGGISLLGVIISNFATRQKQETAFKVSQAVTEEKIETLAREVRQHNEFGRTVPILQEHVRQLEHRIELLEVNK